MIEHCKILFIKLFLTYQIVRMFFKMEYFLNLIFFLQFTAEILREKEYYRLHSLPYPKENLEKSNKDKVESSPYEAYYGNNNCNYHRDDEQVAVEFATCSEDVLRQVKPRYIRCSSQITINHLKKFIAMQVYGNPDKHRDVMKKNLLYSKCFQKKFQIDLFFSLD